MNDRFELRKDGEAGHEHSICYINVGVCNFFEKDEKTEEPIVLSVTHPAIDVDAIGGLAMECKKVVINDYNFPQIPSEQ